MMGPRAITTVDNADHPRLRKLMVKGVGKAAISFYYPALRRKARQVIDEMYAAQTNPKLKDSNRPDVLSFVRTFTFDSICGFIGGADPAHEQALKDLRKDFFIWSAGMSDFFIPAWFPWGPYRNGMKARVRILAKLASIVNERRQRTSETGEVFNDALGHLVAAREDDGSELTMEEIGDNFITLCFAGFDTTSASLCSILHCLVNAISATDLDLLTKELTSLPEPIEEATLTALPNLDALTKEMQRRFPPVVAVIKQCTEDFEVDGVRVGEGCSVSMGIADANMDPEIYPEPEEFRLSRFRDDGLDKKRPYDFMPFSTGARMCLGMHLARMEMKVFTLELLRNYVATKGAGEVKFQAFPVKAMIAPMILTPRK
ncbi:hypothetical protein HK101_003966 [Irineochytrium annulatum]|nr:hypothetical protein HK101_003966 [Irineochytrium annulatum]